LDNVTSSNKNRDFNCRQAGIINVVNQTYEELFNHIDFDLRTRIALGLFDLSEAAFSETTIFNFQNRLIEYYIKTGVNLLERVFDRLTSEQLKALKIKTNI